MRIAFIGAQCTGKTTLINALSEEFVNGVCLGDMVIKEVIRTLVKNDATIKHDKDADSLSQDRYFYEYIRLNTNCKDWIMDRNLPDVCGYTLWLMTHGKVPYSTFHTQFTLAKNYFAEENNKDILLFYTPILWDVKGDGFRSEDPVYREGVDRCIHLVLDELGINYITLDNDNEKWREDKVLGIIQDIADRDCDCAQTIMHDAKWGELISPVDPKVVAGTK